MGMINFLNGFRKMSVMFLVICVASTFRVLGYIAGQEFVDIITPVAVAFMSVNGIEHMTKTISAWMQKKAEKEISK